MSPLSGVLGEAWALYRRFAAHFLAIAFVIYLITAIVVALLALAGPVGVGIGAIADFVGYSLVVAALVKAVQDVRDGRIDLNLGDTVSAALPYLLTVAVAGFLASIGIAIGLALIIVPGLILLTFWSLIAPSIVIDGEGIFGSFGRSWRTVRGYAWPVFGTYVLVFLLYVAFRIVLSAILFALTPWIRDFVSSVVSGTLVTPFVAAVVTLIYYRLMAARGEAGGREPGWPPAGATMPPPSPTPPPGSPPPGSTTPPSDTTMPPSDATMPPGTPMPPPPGPRPPPDSPPPERPA
jgi:hypothetical protein